MNQSWAEVKLGSLCEKAQTVKKKEQVPSHSFLYLDIGGIDNSSNKIIGHKNFFWKDAPSRAQQIVKQGDILFSTVRTYLKNIAQVKNPLYDGQICSSGFTVIRGKQGLVNSDFIFFYSISDVFIQPLNDLQTGSSYPAVRDKDVFAQTIPLPPLPEQRAIVSKLEQLFSELEDGVANLQKARRQLKVYRQAVLKKAFEGELTREWRARNSIDKEWSITQLDEVIDGIQAGKSFRCDERPPSMDEVGILKVSAVTWGEFNELESKTVVDESRINIDYFVEEGDFLMSRANTIELVGNAVIVKNVKRKLMLSDKTLRISFNEDVSSYYVLYYLRSHSGRLQIEKLSTGNQASMRNIGQKRIRQIELPMPEVREQHQIVQEIESRLSVCDQLEKDIEANLKRAERLRQSLLQKAFAGELLTEAELQACRAAPDWEPAERLLARIKGEKTASKA
ncbi:MAG: restriction endonuclease subunit S [bacterium]|nr:restriction endonuclease subunit S [bacterium]